MRLLLAGAENKSAFDALMSVGAKNILMSYYGLRKLGEGAVRDMIKTFRDNGGEFVFLDSGAFSFLTAAGIVVHDEVVKGAKIKDVSESPESYFNEYLEWLEKFGDLFDVYCELDVGRIVGTDKIREWREIIKKRGLGKKLIVVWHSDETGFDDYENLCKEYEYVAVPGRMRFPEYVSCINVAKKYKTKIHGFGLTKHEIISRIPFFSVDSTSWLAGSQYGVTCVFKGNKLITWGKDEKTQRRRFKNELVKVGINWEKIEQDDSFEVNKMNAYAWIKYGEYLDKKLEHYWEERTDGIEEKRPINPEFEKYKGRIQEICKGNPEVEEKRLRAVIKSNKLMPKNFKHGKYASILPQTCNGCYAGEKGKCPFYVEPKNEEDRPVCVVSKGIREVFDLDSFDIKDRDSVLDTVSLLAKIMIERIGMQIWFEKLDGGILDKTVTSAIKTLGDLLRVNTPESQINTQINVNKQVVKKIYKIEDEKARTRILQAIREAYREFRD